MTAFGILVCLCPFWILSVAAADSRCKLDLGLVVDTTKSIKEENIPILKESLRRLVEQFDVSEDGTHVSLETFAKESILHNYFKDSDSYNKVAVLDLIENSIGDLSKPTRLDMALQIADEIMFTHENGHRYGVRSVMLLFTDGRSHPRKTDVAKYMAHIRNIKSKGVRVVVVAVGPDAQKRKYRMVLNAIGGTELFFVDDYEELSEVVSDITTLICPPNPCQNSPGMDVAFLADKTQSIGRKNFKLIIGFLLELTDALTIGPDATHTGIIVFANTPEVLNTFSYSEYYSEGNVHDLIESIHNQLGNQTFIDRALNAANNELFTVEGGDRPEFPNVLILLTDGRTNLASEPFSDVISSLQAKGVRIIAIGVGDYQKFEGQLEEIAGDNVYTADTFNQLSDLFIEILNETCSVDGGFSRWGFWSDCSVTCGDGVQTRTRTCTNPPPQGFGNDCDGDMEERRPCNGLPCMEKRDPELFKYRRRLHELERDWDHGQLLRRNPKFPRKVEKIDDATE